MGRRGPRPKPDAVKRLHGETRPSRLNQRAPVPTVMEVPTPRWLSPRAKQIWRRLAPELIRVRVLTVLDGPAFAVYCCSVALLQEAWEDVKKNGPVLKVERPRYRRNGQLLTTDTVYLKNPALGIVKDYTTIVRQYAIEFGLTPSARTAINVLEPVLNDDSNDLD